MKKIGIWLLSLLFLNIGASFAVSSLDTFHRAYNNKLITLTEEHYADGSITREQFAPILLSYIQNIAKKEYKADSCKALDLEKSDLKYREALTTLCKYGIISGESGRLYPLWKLTNGQSVVLIMRILHGTLPETTENGKHRAENYFEKAEQEGYAISQLRSVKNAPISFENLIHLLYSTQQPNQLIEKYVMPENETAQFKDSDEALKKLAEIMAS